LPVTTRLLYVTAHPDDEHNGLLVYLSRGKGIRTTLMSLTRGEGGQNAVGRELGEALAVLRTAELEAVHRYDGTGQLFGRARDFGLSFSVDESLDNWGREATLGDVVEVFRRFRPDIVLTLPKDAPGAGQHHQAASRLALEAFRVAADPSRFPEQIERGLRPFQARKIYATGTGGFSAALPGPSLEVPVGQFDPLLGATWEELGLSARARHRSQGMGIGVPKSNPAVLSLLDAEPAVTQREREITDGVPEHLSDLASFVPPGPKAELLHSGLLSTQTAIEAAREAFDPNDLSRVIPPLRNAATTTAKLVESLAFHAERARADLELRLTDTQRELHRALGLAWGLSVEASVDDAEVVRGQKVHVALTAIHHGPEPMEILRFAPRVPDSWTLDGEQAEMVRLAPGVSLTRTFTVTVGSEAPYTAPGARRMEEALPTDEPPLSPLLGVLTWRCGEATIVTQNPALPFDVVPRISVGLSPEVIVLPLNRPRPLEVRAAVRNHGPSPADGEVRLELPPGFGSEPAVHRIQFRGPDEERHVRFLLRPPATLEATRFALVARASLGDETVDSSIDVIDYPHISRHLRLRPARALLLAASVRTQAGARVGWIRGTGDVGGEAVAALGISCDALGPEDLAFADLSRYTTILVGVRAYEVRPDLRMAHRRLLDWVRTGGHLVVQYQRDGWNARSAESPFAPYPASVTPRRLTDERTPLQFLVPNHPLLRHPNAIGPEDLKGWVQERGIQFLDARDDRYVELLAGEDPFPMNAGRKTGMLVVASVGKGTWTYVGLGLFRQLPAGVPGAWRLFANLVSRRPPPPPHAQ
jgi:LmbE family N-acetylglucosaminyl deacetylase